MKIIVIDVMQLNMLQMIKIMFSQFLLEDVMVPERTMTFWVGSFLIHTIVIFFEMIFKDMQKGY